VLDDCLEKGFKKGCERNIGNRSDGPKLKANPEPPIKWKSVHCTIRGRTGRKKRESRGFEKRMFWFRGGLERTKAINKKKIRPSTGEAEPVRKVARRRRPKQIKRKVEKNNWVGSVRGLWWKRINGSEREGVDKSGGG